MILVYHSVPTSAVRGTAVLFGVAAEAELATSLADRVARLEREVGELRQEIENLRAAMDDLRHLPQ